MHLAVRTHGLYHSQDGDLAIHRHSDVGFEVSILHQGVSETGMPFLPKP